MNNLVKIENNQSVVSSRDIAGHFEKAHGDVLKSINNLVRQNSLTKNMFIEKSREYRGQNFRYYLMNRDGFSLLVMGFTGAKALEWKIKYIQAFNDMEQQLREKVVKPADDLKEKRLVVMHRNAKVREANIWLKLAQGGNENFKQICRTYAANLLAEREIVALPEVDRKTYTATEIGKILGISANKVGRLTTAHNLKTAEYGGWYHDKSRYSNKEIETFRYHENVIDKLKEILKNNKKGAKITNDDIIYAQENLPEGIDSIIIERIDCDEEDA